MRKPKGRDKHKSRRRHVLWTVRVGHTPGHYTRWSGEGGAEEQVDGFPDNCNLGFTRRQVDKGMQHKYLKGRYTRGQIMKIRRGRRVEEEEDDDETEVDDDETEVDEPDEPHGPAGGHDGPGAPGSAGAAHALGAAV